MAGEGQSPGFFVHPENGEIVGPLVAGIEERPRGIETETARVVPARPFLADKGQLAGFTGGEDPDAVVEAVAGVDEPAVGGHQDLGAEIAAGESRRQAGDGLPRGQPALVRIVVEEDHGGAFLLDRVEPAPVWMEGEMPRPVSRRQRDRGGIVGDQLSGRVVEFPDKDLIQPQIDRQNEASCGIGLDHVRVGLIMPAEGEAAWGRVGGLGGADRSRVFPDVGGGAEAAVGQNRKHRHGAAEVVGDQNELSGRMHAEMGRPLAAGRDGVEQSRLPVRRMEGEGADRPPFLLADPLGFVGRIEARLRGVERQGARARAHFMHPGRRQGPGGAVDPKEVNAAAVSRRQINLGRPDVLERRSVGADVSHERLPGSVGRRCQRALRQERSPGQGGGGLEKGAPGEGGRRGIGRRTHGEVAS